MPVFYSASMRRTPVRPQRPQQHFRTLWISDVHLGSRECKAEMLLSFLEFHTCDQIYLVGDIVDLWGLRRSPYWRQSHSEIVDHLMRRSMTGTNVTYICGNHDESFRDYMGMQLGSIRICNERVHRTADGKRLLVTHGDQHDTALRCGKLLEHVGDRAYMFVLRVDHWLHILRRRLGLPFWSLAKAAKQRVPQATSFIARFEELAAREAKQRMLDGVVCGHIHQAALRDIDGVTYANCGDWVESCTAMVEHRSGELELVRFGDPSRVREYNPQDELMVALA